MSTLQPRGQDPTNLADILERVLDRGVVIAGDIRINLLDIELLTIKLRLVVASVDTAREMGIDWWERDPFLSSRPRGPEVGAAPTGNEIESDGDRRAVEAEPVRDEGRLDARREETR
ncbi:MULTISPECIES: gas vesicle protein [Polymorphospora]|uniref:Gas vesicle protein n=1 Tax=Polymorphospora lycopeni TaxID=3140240 RepID=A0ABV5CV69_9ACTN